MGSLAHDVGQTIPPDTPHAVSVSLPSWRANVGYEEGENWVLSKMKTGYPRFFIHKQIQAFADAIVSKYGEPYEQAFLFPSHAVSVRCIEFLKSQQALAASQGSLRILDLYPDSDLLEEKPKSAGVKPTISAVIFPKEDSKIAKTFWQHTGDGISSRQAEYCYKAFRDGHLAVRSSTNETNKEAIVCKGPRRYRTMHSVEAPPESQNDPLDARDYVRFVEERFGRNLDLSLAKQAKRAIRRRIAGALNTNIESINSAELAISQQRTARVRNFSEDDVYLHPSGMSSIFNAHQLLMACRGSMRSISFGFPYIDTLKILQKWGPGCLFYGRGSSEDINDLERRCMNGEHFLGLFCEFPGNPLLNTPDLEKLRSLADRFDFAIVVDETIGNFINVDVQQFADIVVSSLTKVFTGECNVMGGSTVLNPGKRYYEQIKSTMDADYEDIYWPEDAIFMERNSRDFISRIQRINANAEAICETLSTSSIVDKVFYPKSNSTRPFYDRCRNPEGGYGGLLSVTFETTEQAMTFFDTLDTAKGPSLGTNFTLSSPYVILAHYAELEWVKQYGVNPDLVRISVGLEDSFELCAKINVALVAAARTSNGVDFWEERTSDCR